MANFGSTGAKNKTEMFRHAERWLKSNPGKNLGAYRQKFGIKELLKTRQRKGDPVRVTYKGASTEAEKARAERLKVTNEAINLTDEEKKTSKAKKKVISQQRDSKGKVMEGDHDNAADLVGKMIQDAQKALREGRISQADYNKMIENLRKRKVGDMEGNIVARTGEENRQKAVDEGKLQKKLGQMEKNKPSDLQERYAYELQDWQKMFERDTVRSNHWRGTDQNIPQELQNAANYINTASQSYSMLQKLAPVVKGAGQFIWGAVKLGAGSLVGVNRI